MTAPSDESGRRVTDRHLAGGAAAACAACCAAPLIGFLGLAGAAATAVTLAVAGAVFALVVGTATVAAMLVRRRRRPRDRCVLPTPPEPATISPRPPSSPRSG